MNFIYIFLSAVLLCSCGGAQKNAGTVSQTSAVDPAKMQNEKEMMKFGDDFYAQGSTPANWSLKMNYDNKISFSADDGLELNFGANNLKKQQEGKKTVFKGNVSAGDLTINIEDGICTNPTERFTYNKIVSVTFKSKTYSGCGKFLSDANLSGKWLLEKIGYTAINPAEYNKVPMLVFDQSTNRVSGNDGCNSIGGSIEVQGSRIRFSQMVGTKMACAKKSIDGILTKQVSDQLVDYYFRDGKLHLYLPDDSLLVFGKGS